MNESSFRWLSFGFRNIMRTLIDSLAGKPESSVSKNIQCRELESPTTTFDILIPAYNESQNIERIETQLIPQLIHDGIICDITIINDGSKDSTGILAEALSEEQPNVSVIHHERNLGLGAALRTGYNSAKHPWIITIDCDMSYSPDQIRNLVDHIDDDVDAIFGSPYLRGGKVKGVSGFRLLPSIAVSAMYSVVMAKRLSCWTGLFRAIRRSAISEIEINQEGFDGVAEIAIKLVKKGFRIIEIPSVLGTRTYGDSKAAFNREFMKHLKLLFNAVTNSI